MIKKLTVKAFWDSEANVWVAESDDVPGLITEANTMEKLIDKLHSLIPELLQENSILQEQDIQEIPFLLYSERMETLRCG